MTARKTRQQLAGKIGGLTNAATHDMAQTGRKGAAGLMERFRREADPDGALPADVRERKALLLRRSHFARLAMASAQARKAVRA